MSEQWILWCGIHDGTILGRDTDKPTAHDTEQEALDAFAEFKQNVLQIRYQIWFARLTGPDGRVTILEENPYKR